MQQWLLWCWYKLVILLNYGIIDYCSGKKLKAIHTFPTVYDYVTEPTNTTCGPVALGEETSPPPSEDPMTTTNTAYAVGMEEEIVAANNEET